jgi:hypothetical protein
MGPFNNEKTLRYARHATTEELLDRVTVYREGMEPEALGLFEDELRRRGITREQREEHARQPSRQVLHGRAGLPRRCSSCERPAVAVGWGWHWLWGRLPLFPRRVAYCAEHRPKS